MTNGINPEGLLHKRPARQVTFALPDLVSDRLDALVDVLNGEEGQEGRIYRQDIVAALIGMSKEGLAELSALIKDYRNLKNRQAVVGAPSNVIELRSVSPGRRVPPPPS
jgi:hypothetical protein